MSFVRRKRAGLSSNGSDGDEPEQVGTRFLLSVPSALARAARGDTLHDDDFYYNDDDVVDHNDKDLDHDDGRASYDPRRQRLHTTTMPLNQTWVGNLWADDCELEGSSLVVCSPLFELSSLCGLFCRNICHPTDRNPAERHFAIKSRPPSGKTCDDGNIPSDLAATRARVTERVPL